MLSGTYADDGGSDRRDVDDLDAFDARIDAAGRVRPEVRRVSPPPAMPAGGRKAVAASRPPMAGAPPAAPARKPTGRPALTEEEEERAQDIADVGALPGEDPGEESD